MRLGAKLLTTTIRQIAREYRKVLLKKIAFPLDSDSHGLEVVNLQDALRFLVDQRFYGGDPEEPHHFAERMQEERADRRYGDFTGRLVVMFQNQTQGRFHLIESGIVDAETARAITQVLQELGALPMPPVSEQMRLVAGVVRRADQQPFPGAVVSAFHKAERGPLRLGQDTTDTDGQYTIRYSMISGIDSINLFVTVSNTDGERLGGSDTFPHAEPVAFVDVQLTQPEVKPPAVETPAVQRSMEGRVVYENGLPAEGITLRLYQHVFNSEPVSVSETVTQPFGLYALAYSSTGSAAGLEVRAVNAEGGEEPLTKTLNDLGEGDRALVNLVASLSLQPQPAEFDRLAADLAPHVGDMSSLAGVVEDDKRQDLTLLNRAAGWDARLIAMASKAAVLSTDPRVDLPQPVAYALFRMGLPTERLQLAQVNPEVLSQALDSAVKSGIVALAPPQLDEVKTKLETFTGQTRLSMPAPGSTATYSDLLQATSVAPDVQDRFATVFLSHRGDPGQLWKKAADAGVPKDDIMALQRQGKLAYLTANNVALTTRLLQTMQVSDPLELVDKDLY
jgi:hypothetical protein